MPFFFLLLLCFLGYCLLLCRTRQLAFAFAPAVTTAFLTVAMLVAGVCRILLPVSYGLYALGLLLFVVETGRLLLQKKFLLLRKKETWLSLLPVFLWILGSFLIFSALAVRSYFPTHSDNFSHWSVVARLLLKADRFPTPADTDLISFRSYIPGSAAFLYFCCKNLHLVHSGALLFAQAFAVYNFYFCVFGGIRAEKPIPLALEYMFCALAVSALVPYNIALNDLQVDNLVGACMTASVLLTCAYGDRLDLRAPELALLAAACCCYKTSGLLLLFFLLLILELVNRKNARQNADYDLACLRQRVHGGAVPVVPKADYLPHVLILALPVLVFGLWKLHCTLTFSLQGVGLGKNNSSISNLISNTGTAMARFQKSEIILPIFFVPSKNRSIFAVAWILCLFFLKGNQTADPSKGHSPLRTILLDSFLFFLLCEITLFVTYLFSMSLSQLSGSTSSLYRYNRCVSAVPVGILAFCLLRELETFDLRKLSSYLSVAVSVLVIAFVFGFSLPKLPVLARLQEQYPDYVYLENLVREDRVTAEDTVLVLFQKNYKNRANGTNYFLYPCTDVTVTYDEKEFQKARKEGSYSIILDLTKGTVTDENGTESLA